MYIKKVPQAKGLCLPQGQTQQQHALCSKASALVFALA